MSSVSKIPHTKIFHVVLSKLPSSLYKKFYFRNFSELFKRDKYSITNSTRTKHFEPRPLPRLRERFSCTEFSKLSIWSLKGRREYSTRFGKPLHEGEAFTQASSYKTTPDIITKFKTFTNICTNGNQTSYHLRWHNYVVKLLIHWIVIALNGI